jgi:predicted dehydrogenase
MKKVRCAVLGAGWWSTAAHIPSLRDNPKADLVAVQKRDRSMAQKVARDFQVPNACTTVEEVLALDLDAVVVGSTPNQHFSQAKAVIERGLHVLIEKPMTITAAEAEELVDLAALKGVECLVGCTWHYTSHAAAALELVNTGALGEIKMVNLLMMDHLVGLYKKHTWKQFAEDCPDPEVEVEPYMAPNLDSYGDPAVAGGGQIYAQVSHAVGYLAYLTKDEPVSVQAFFDTGGTEVDVYDTINVKMAKGTIVSIGATGNIGGATRRLVVNVYGTEGVLELELFYGKMKFWSFATGEQKFPDLPEAELYPKEAPAENLVDVALGDAPNLSPGTIGLTSMRIIDAACQSARQGGVVTLP